MTQCEVTKSNYELLLQKFDSSEIHYYICKLSYIILYFNGTKLKEVHEKGQKDLSNQKCLHE